MVNLFDIDIRTRKRARRNLLLLLRRDHGSDSMIEHFFGSPVNSDREFTIQEMFPWATGRSNWDVLVDDVSDVAESFTDFAIVRSTRKLTSMVYQGISSQLSPSRIKWLRVGGKLGGRFIPVVGWGLLAYDLYNLGEDLDFY
jgi:hypothetical protein